MRSPALASAFLGALLAWSFVGDMATAPRLEAQARPGEYALYQNGVVVGWLWVNGAQTLEYWAYIEGVYEWADIQHTCANRWKLEAEFIGANCPSSYSAWKNDVAGRHAVGNHKLTFQRHTID